MKEKYISYSLIQEYKNLMSLIGYYKSQLRNCDEQLPDIESIISGNVLLHQPLPQTEVINSQLLEKQKYYSSQLFDSTKKLREFESREDFDIEYANYIIAFEESKNIQILGKSNHHNEYETDCDTFCNIL